MFCMHKVGVKLTYIHTALFNGVLLQNLQIFERVGLFKMLKCRPAFDGENLYIIVTELKLQARVG